MSRLTPQTTAYFTYQRPSGGDRARSPARQPASRRAATSSAATAAGSLVALATLIGLLAWLQNDGAKSAGDREPLLVYCAVSAEPALRPIAEAYERDSGTPVNIQTGSSGALEAQIRLSNKGDLFIPAARTPYLDRCQDDGTVTTVVPLAEFQLVLAIHPRVKGDDITLDDLVEGRLRYAIANDAAAAGLVTRDVLEPLVLWPRLRERAKVFLPTVTGVALAVDLGVAVDCGFVWDTTARQFELPFVELPELATGRAVVAVGVLSCSRDAMAAQRFVDYITAADKGQSVFKDLGYHTFDAPATTEASDTRSRGL